MECNVDIKPVVAFRTVRFERNLREGEASRARLYVPEEKMGQPCTTHWENGTEVTMDAIINGEAWGKPRRVRGSYWPRMAMRTVAEEAE